MKANKTPAPEPAEPWVLSQEPGGVWSAMIHLRGEWVPLGYFGAREDAEATIAACLKPGPRLERSLIDKAIRAAARLKPG